MKTKRCDHCKKEKDIEEFNWKFKALGIRHDTCRECMKWFVKRYFKGSAHDEHLRNVKERKKQPGFLPVNTSGNILQLTLACSVENLIREF